MQIAVGRARGVFELSAIQTKQDTSRDAREATVAGAHVKSKLSPPAVPRRCEGCGELLDPRFRSKRFCSKRCRDRVRKRRLRANPPADVAAPPLSHQLENAENAESRARFLRERELRDRKIRDEEAAHDREVQRIEASGERVAWLFSVPAPSSIVALLRDNWDD
jgi:hypothetical protein